MTRFGIGQAVKRIEDKKLVQGKGKFISDLNFDDQAYMVIIRSPYARAKILNIDFSELDNVSMVLLVMLLVKILWKMVFMVFP